MNNPQKIKETTGYYPGNVYIYDKGKDKNEQFFSPDRYDDPLTYDPCTGNFHIIPNNTDFIQLVRNARKSIIEMLKKDTEKIATKVAGQSKMLLCEHRDAYARNNEFRNIEIAVHIEWKGNTYLLCFERLYTHKDKVHCMFGLFQFYKYPTADNYINRVNKSFSMCYPASFRNNKKQQKDKHIVCNPQLPSVFELNDNNNLEAVCKAFINFIENNS